MGIASSSVNMNIVAAAGSSDSRRGVRNEAAEYAGEDFGDGLEVTEVTDLKGFDPAAAGSSTIYLAGSRLPKVPFTWGGTQRITKEYYPGNPEPAMQVLGSQENNVTIEGKWTDRRQKDRQALASWKLQEYFDALRRRGHLLYIRLGTWQRYCYLEECEFQMKNLRDIDWKLTFAIIGRDKPFNNFFAKTQQEIPLNSAAQIAVATAPILHVPPPPFPRAVYGQIQPAQDSLWDKVATLANFIDKEFQLAEATLAKVTRAILLVKAVRSEISRYKRRLGFLIVDAGSLYVNATSDREIQKWKDLTRKGVLDMLAAPSDRFASQADAAAAAALMLTKESSRTAAERISSVPSLELLMSRLDKQFRALARTVPQARHSVKDGDTLAKIAIKYYKDAAQWKRIYDHNKLTSTNLVSGTVLEVPKL